MDLPRNELDVSDLQTVRRFAILHSRAERLENRAFVLRHHHGNLPANRVPAMNPSPWFEEPQVARNPERDVFDTTVGEARSL